MVLARLAALRSISDLTPIPRIPKESSPVTNVIATGAAWITTRESRLRPGVSQDRFSTSMRRGAFTLRRLPGLRSGVRLDDVERPESQSIRPERAAD
jgi:hypothetical protein